MGWVWLLLLGAGAMGALVLLGVPRLLWSFVGAALMLGAAGYALQGRPGLPASPAVAARAAAEDDSGLVSLREAMWGRFTGDGQWLVAADAMARAGEKRSAVRVVLSGIRATPDSALLWTGLGTALARHDGAVSPPARFAFARAMRLAPGHPGPPFFLGLALVREGDFAGAQTAWRRALALAPARAAYRGEIAGRLALLDRLLAMEAGGR